MATYTIYLSVYQSRLVHQDLKKDNFYFTLFIHFIHSYGSVSVWSFGIGIGIGDLGRWMDGWMDFFVFCFVILDELVGEVGKSSG